MIGMQSTQDFLNHRDAHYVFVGKGQYWPHWGYYGWIARNEKGRTKLPAGFSDSVLEMNLLQKSDGESAVDARVWLMQLQIILHVFAIRNGNQA